MAQGNPLGPEFRVNTYTTNDQVQPSIAADSAGNFVVVWQGLYQYNQINVFGQRYDSSGAPLGSEFRVNTAGLGGNSAPSVGADPGGNFVVIWEWQPLEAAGLLAQLFASSGAPIGGPFAVGSTSYSFAPDVAGGSSSNFVVVWHSSIFGGMEYNVFAQRSLGPAFRVNTYTTGDQTAASVAADPSGNFVVVWSSSGQDGSDLGIFGQRYDSSGAPLGSEFRVNTYTTNSQGHPSVTADPSGNFVVVWESAFQDGFNAGVFGQRFASSGVPLGPEFRVNTLTTGDQSSASIAADASGNFVVVWGGTLQDGGGGGVFGQRFDSSGEPVGSEFRVNTYTTNDQADPAVAADPLGSFVVVWESNLQDGSGDGVFGQRWRPMVPVELMDLRLE
jgi:hypothetical protein